MKKVIGYIGQTHCLNGNVKIISMINNDEFKNTILNKIDTFIEQENKDKKIYIDIVVFNGKSFICKVKDINSIEDAKNIQKKEIFIKIDDNQNYISPELILNYNVYIENTNIKYGKIIDYGDYGNGPLIEVKTMNNKYEFYRCDYSDIIKVNNQDKYIIIKKRNCI